MIGLGWKEQGIATHTITLVRRFVEELPMAIFTNWPIVIYFTKSLSYFGNELKLDFAEIRYFLGGLIWK